MTNRNGFTLVELIVAMVLVFVMTLGAGILLADGQKKWNRLYNRVNDPAGTDGFVVQRAFENICRKSSGQYCYISSHGSWLQLYYWDEGSTEDIPENYARIYQDGSKVYAEYGKLFPRTWYVNPFVRPEKSLLTKEVDDLEFEQIDKGIQMFLTYEDDSLLPVVTSAVRRN
jgi:prepilin-type N-terminal cleavage/methylation domain-containing protein